jgi:CBS domain containing-hemolysin-like protein
MENITVSGEIFIWEGYRLEVVDMDGPTVGKVLVQALADEDKKNAGQSN